METTKFIKMIYFYNQTVNLGLDMKSAKKKWVLAVQL